MKRLKFLVLLTFVVVLIADTEILSKDNSIVNEKNPFIYIPSGCFNMGSNYGEEDEKPVHEVCLSGYNIQKYEVTNREYDQCVKDKKCSPVDYNNCYVHNGTNWGKGGKIDEVFKKDNHPVVCVNWQQAVEYCKWAGGDLPTEAQWEYAALGKDGKKYPWGDKPPDGGLVNYCDKSCDFHQKEVTLDDGYKYTSPVGSFKKGKSPFGLYDMSGNVWEWVMDWYSDKYYKTSGKKNPVNNQKATKRVTRGSGWYGQLNELRASDRDLSNPDYGVVLVGFRCTRP